MLSLNNNMKEEENKIPFYNLPEKVQTKLDKTYGQYWLDYLKSLDQDHLDLWLHVSGVER